MKVLFNQKTIEKHAESVIPVKKQIESAYEWLNMLKKNELEDEERNYNYFYELILRDVLGYDRENIIHHQDNVEYQIKGKSGKSILCMELKGTKTKDLYAEQHRYKEHQRTPISQTHYYMWKIGLDYGVCSNYRKFIMLDKDKVAYEFDFMSIENNKEKLKEFITVFSKSRIVDKSIEELRHDSIIEEKEFTKEFYKLFHETRLMLIKSFQDKENVSKTDAIYYSQIFLNRLIFIFFVEDMTDNRIFYHRVVKLLEMNQPNKHSKKVYEDISELFKIFDKGEDDLKIFGYNGGLFSGEIPPKVYFDDIRNKYEFKEIWQHSQLLKSTKLDENAEKIVKKYPNLNPIISNLLIMDSFDFNTEVNVNILGHIFEQSISDLEELQKEGISKRKKEGVYYTPEHITDYVCRNTIIPYLSKSGKITNVYDLVDEYSDNLSYLEQKFRSIKILDPACGSGAFLVKAVEVLLDIYRAIHEYKLSRGEYSKGGQLQLTKWSEETEIRGIITNNIFGVDVNNESVGITKLSLFLMLATGNKKLSDLSKNIMSGNSLISDKSISVNAFSWEDKFPEIIKSGKFDVVIGNPPYFNIETLGVNSSYANGVKDSFPEVWMDKSDILFYFIAQGINLSKSHVGFIVSNAFLFSDKAKKLRNYILKNTSFSKIVNFEQYHVFEDADITTAIIFLEKDKKYSKTKALVLSRNDYEERYLVDTMKQNKSFFDVKLRKDSVFALVNNEIDALNLKIDSAGVSLGDLFKVGKGMETGSNSIFDFNTIPNDFPKNTIKKRITGDIIHRYYIDDAKKFCLYVDDFEEFDQIPISVKKYLEMNKNKLSSRADKKRRKTAKWWNYTFPLHKKLYIHDKIWCSYRSKENCFAYDDTQDYIGLTNTTVIFGTNEKISLKYVLALLNSTLLNFRYKSIGKQTGSGLFEYFENGISKIPIPEIPSEEQEPFIQKSTELRTLHGEYYDKYNKFLSRLVNNYNLKINSKLKQFNELTFEDFFKVILKQNIKLTFEQQEELENYFKDRKDSLFEIKRNIELIEKEIDNLTFKLYGITKDEQELIYKNIDDKKHSS